jgi:hypothetical protein
MQSRSKVVVLVLVSVLSLGGATAYVGNAALDAHRVAKRSAEVKGQAVPVAFKIAAITAQQSYIVFRHTDAKDPYTYGRVALAPLGDIARGTVITKVKCARVAFSGGLGTCLVPPSGFGSSNTGWILGSDLSEIRKFDIFGRPTRTRVSRDGKLAAATVFDLGGAHSYASPGSFATKTTLIDVATGKTLANLEQFKVFKNGKLFKNVNFNFWGVTFTSDHDVFYATLQSGKTTYLVRGNLKTRTIKTLFTNVECPSLSPDQTRIAYKRRMLTPGAPLWRISVLNLATGRVTMLSEQKTIDDQAEWLDDAHVLYGRDGNVWKVNADGSGRPTVFIRNADSPAVVR